MNEEGLIKFHCERTPAELGEFKGFHDLNRCRATLHRLHFIGETASGIGYGNVSARIDATEQFHITGAATGGLAQLGPEHYARVTACEIFKNEVKCEGAIDASSETMTHAAIYRAAPDVRAVLHVHHPAMWRNLANKVPTTAKDVEYGTPMMAHEIGRLFRDTDVKAQRILVMAGHENGIVVFGPTLPLALSALLSRVSG